MTKKLTFFIFFIAVFATFSIAKNFTPIYFLTAKENKYLQKKKFLKVYIKKDWAPFKELEFGNINEYLKEYTNLIGKKLGIKIIFVKKVKSNKNIFKQNKIDMIIALHATKKRYNMYIFSKKDVFNIYISLVIPKCKCIKNIKSFQSKKIAVVKDSYIAKTLKKFYPKIHFIECATNLDTLKFVLRKKAKAAIGNYFVLSYLIDRNFISGLSNFYIHKNKYIKKIPEFVAFDKNNTILKRIIDKTINNINKEEIYLLREKWLRPPIKKMVFLTKKEKQFLKTHTISIATTTTWLPMNSKDKNGHIVGIGIDYWKIIAKKAHIKYKFFIAKNFDTVLKDIKDKKYDINMATSKTLDKEQYSLFSKTYEKFPIAIATKKGKKFIINGIELGRKKVAVGKSYSTYFLLKSVYPNMNFVFTKNTKNALELVEKNKVFAAVDIEPVLRYQIIYNNFNNIDITGITGVDFNLQIMIRNDYKILQSIINKSIDTITNEERINIYKKWMGLHEEKSIGYGLIWKISLTFLIAIFIFFIIYLKQKKLQKKIKNLNKTLEDKIKNAIEKNERQQLIMMQQSRLAQMGEVISMIAHQWKQPLNSLSLLNSTIISKYKNSRLSLDIVNKFEKQTKKIILQMSNTIDDFRNFFKPEKEKIIFSLENAIADSIDLISPILKNKKIILELKLNYNINILGYPNELGQAIINIINNSKDALMDSQVKDKMIFIETKKIKNYVTITIRDNAGGMPEDILSKIFNPYFSTKTKKHGTGLGLYMTKIIIEDHFKGRLNICNFQNGTKVQITLGVVNEIHN